MILSMKTNVKINTSMHFSGTALFAAVLFFMILLLSACSAGETAPLPVVEDYMPDPIIEIKDLRVGVVSGPYRDMFTEAIIPSLEKKGYTVTFEYYQDYESPNFALSRNDIDLNVFQHYAYLNTFKFEHDLALSAIIEIPTVSMSVFSHKIKTLNDFIPGNFITVPDDASNLARALRVLETANILTLNPAIDKSKATIADIILNPYAVRLMPAPAHDLVDSLDKYEASVIPGNFAVSSGLDLSEALYRETLTENYKIVIAVRTDDLNKQFVRDIIEIAYSGEFRDAITDPDGKYTNFQWPRWLHDAMEVAE